MNIESKRDPGDSIRIETTVKEKAPFEDTGTKVDPDTIKITIVGPSNSTIVSDQSMSKNNIGEYYYGWNTNSTTITGDYTASITTVKGDSSEVDEILIRLSDD